MFVPQLAGLMWRHRPLSEVGYSGTSDMKLLLYCVEYNHLVYPNITYYHKVLQILCSCPIFGRFIPKFSLELNLAAVLSCQDTRI